VLYVVDCARAILQVVKKGRAGEIYNIGSGVELKNIDIVKNILDILNKPYSLIGFVADRPGHDFRYSLSSSKIIKELGWKPVTDFKYGLKQTVAWYKDNLRWMELKSHN
jgi:dTDP-glucose 4,6-dehydratase